MDFCINLVVDPHVAALVQDGVVVAESTWTDHKQDQRVLHALLRDLKSPIDRVVVVAGPGGNNALRTTSVVADAVALRYSAPIVNVSAGAFVRSWLLAENRAEIGLLRSFGQRVFLVDAQGAIELQDLAIAAEQLQHVPVWADALPELWQANFEHKTPPLQSPWHAALLAAAVAVKPSKTAVAEYYFPAVS